MVSPTFKKTGGFSLKRLIFPNLVFAHPLNVMESRFTVVYDFFKSKPFDRFYAAKNGLNRITLGYWKDIQNKYIIVLVIACGFIAISFASVLYFRYFFNFVINRILLRKHIQRILLNVVKN